MMPARDLLKEALNVLIEKASTVLAAAEDESNLRSMDAADAAKITIAAMRTEPDDMA
jgi:hypothetical protein